MTDAKHKAVGRASYRAFGGREVTSGVVSTRHGFTGHEHDPNGLINMRGRMYDPTLGRFLTADPIVTAPGFSQSWNRYSYVMNSPFAFTDPTGFEPYTSPETGTTYEVDQVIQV